jgi:hypothetical protein
LIPAAELRARVTLTGVKKANAEAMSFHGTLKAATAETGEATLKANVDGRGFTEFKAKMTDAKLRAAVPIVQEARLKYDAGAFAGLRREIFITRRAMSGLGSDGNLGSALAGGALPLGRIGTAAVAASGPVLSLGGGVVALTGSLAGAAEGAGALAIGLGGMATVGLAGVIPLAVSAVGSLKSLTEAQKAYIAAVETYGVQSKQAETAGRKLLAAEKMSGKEAVNLVGSLDKVKERWSSLTKPGKEALFGAMNDAIDRLDKKLPLVGSSADRSAKAGREGFDQLLSAVTGPDFDRFVKTMTTTEEHVLPQLGRATGDWGRILERIATASAPSLERVVGVFSHWSKEVLSSTGNSHKLQGEISHLVDDTMDWVHLLDASGHLLKDIFDAGEGSGNELVVDTTKQFNEWGEWIDHHGPEVEAFFTQTKDGVEALASILGHAGKDWFVMANAMEPVETLILHILDDFAKVKLGGQSMLTYLLGGFALLKVAIAALKVKDLAEGVGWLRTLAGSSAEEASDIDRLIAALQGQAEAATAAASANADLVASNQAVTDSAQLSMLETGPLADAEKAGQMSMFPMGSGVMPVGAEVEAPAASAVGTGSRLGSLGKAAGWAGAGIIGGQVAGGIIGGKAGGVLSAAGAGAGVGAAVGTLFPEFGGPVTGALVGGGIAAAAKGLADLFSKEKQLTPLQKALKSDAQHAADAFRNQRDAAHGLAQAESVLGASQRRHRDSTQAVTKAHHELNQAVRQFGPDSQQAHQAELNLAKAQKRDAETALEVKDAYKLTKNERQRDRLAITESVAANKQLIPNLQTVVGHLKEQHETQQHNMPLLERLIEKEKQLSGAIQTLGKDYAQAEQVGTEKWVKSLEAMSTVQATYGENLKGLLRQLPSFGAAARLSFGKAEMSTEQLAQKFGHFTDGFKEHTVAPYKEDTKSLSKATTASFATIDKEAETMLVKFGVSSSTFGSKVAGPPAPQHKQDGGFIVGGSGSGDRPGYTGEPGGFVLNRNATAAYGFAEGGRVPLALEPGERYFSKPEVSRIGAHNLASMNASVKRQKGGALGPEPVLSGPGGSLRSIGQDAVHQVYKGASEYVAAHKPKIDAGAGVDVSGLGGTRFDIGAAELKQINAPHIVSLALFEALLDEGGPFGNVLEGEGAGVGAPIMPAAKEISGFLTGHPRWTGTTAMSLANSGEQAYEIAQDVQASGAGLASHGRDNYGKQQAAAEALLRGYGLAAGGTVPVAPALGRKKRKWDGWTPNGRYAPGSSLAQHLITGGEALEVPTTITPTPSTSQVAAEKAAKEAKSKSTPTEAVHWEMSHLGDHDQWGYPGEWCGAFQAAAMQAVGIQPPVGFAAASSWANFGTPLGRDHIQAGAILDYGSAHVAMAISSSQQVQGNDINESVGTSSIGGVIGGSTLTAVRWPPYGGVTGPGAGAAPVEKVPASFHGLATAEVSIGSSTPKTIHGIQREEARRRQEKHAYEAAVKAAAGRPKLIAKLQHNVTALDTRLEQLRKAAAKLRRAIAEKRFSIKLGRAYGNVTGFGKLIEERQREYAERSELAQHLVELEPTEPILPATATEAQRRSAEEAYVGDLTAYIHGKVEPAYTNVLGSEASWRDTILGAELAATRFESGAEGHIRRIEARIEEINAFTEQVGAESQKVGQDVHTYREEHPKGELPDWIQKEQKHLAGDEKKRDELRSKLPQLRYKENGWREKLGEARSDFYGGYAESAGVAQVHPPEPPLAGTGSFEQALIEVQGTKWPALHEKIKKLPTTRAASGFGGVIWDTQAQMEELNLQIAQANATVAPAGSGEEGGALAGGEESPAPTAEVNHEREELLEGLLREANQRAAITGALAPTLAQFEQSYPTAPPYMGAFAEGGVALVGERGPELVGLPNGTRVHSNRDSERMLGGADVHVHVNGDIRQEPGDTRPPLEVELRDPRNQKLIRRVVGTAQRPVVSTGATRAHRGRN